MFSKLLYKLEFFWRLLEPELKVHLVKRFVRMDNSEIGIGEYLLTKEMENLSSRVLLNQTNIDLFCNIKFTRQFTHLLPLQPRSVPNIKQHIAFYSPQLLFVIFTNKFIRELAKHVNEFESDVRFSIVLLILRLDLTSETLKGLNRESMASILNIPEYS